MEILVVYESSYGNTHLIADAIGEGVGTAHTVHVVPVAKATRELVDRADLVVVGGPTHIHGMSRAATREKAVGRQFARPRRRRRRPGPARMVRHAWTGRRELGRVRHPVRRLAVDDGPRVQGHQ